MNASMLRMFINCALKNAKCDYVLSITDGDVVLALENGTFATFLNCVQEEYEMSNQYCSDDDLVNEAMLDGIFDELPELLPELTKSWENEASTTGTGWTPNL